MTNILTLTIIIGSSLIVIFLVCYALVNTGMDKWDKHVMECMQLYHDTRSDLLTDECFNQRLI